MLKIDALFNSKQNVLRDICVIFSEIDYTEMQASKAASRKNMATIKKNYSKLIKNVTSNLNKANPDMSSFHSFVIHMFDAEDLPRAETVQDMFDVLTKKRCWDYLTVYNLESIVEEFSEQYEDQNKKMIKQYKEELAGFKAAIKIIEYMAGSKAEEECEEDEEYVCLLSEKEKYDDKYRKKLSLKLHEGKRGGAKITFSSLQYVEKLWDSLCDEFEMPSLPKLLDSITYGSIIITWIVRRINAQKILSQIFYHVEFLKQEMVIEICLENVCIYNENSGTSTVEVSQNYSTLTCLCNTTYVYNISLRTSIFYNFEVSGFCSYSQVINYLKLLMMKQEGKLQLAIDALKTYFPNMNATINQVVSKLAEMF